MHSPGRRLRVVVALGSASCALAVAGCGGEALMSPDSSPGLPPATSSSRTDEQARSNVSKAAWPIPIQEVLADFQNEQVFDQSKVVLDLEIDSAEAAAILEACSTFPELTTGTSADRPFLGPTGPAPTTRDVVVYFTITDLTITDTQYSEWNIAWGAPSDDRDALLPLDSAEIPTWSCTRNPNNPAYSSWSWHIDRSVDTSTIGVRNSGASAYGENEYLDAIWDHCAQGDGRMCFYLYQVAPAGSAYEQFGGTCGNRVDFLEGPCFGENSVVPSL